jgi:hypothetical protein
MVSGASEDGMTVQPLIVSIRSTLSDRWTGHRE